MSRKFTPQPYPKPPARRLRVYAFDPQASTRPETIGVNTATITLPWEEEWEDPLEPGPVNDYLEVVDVDPASGFFYEPVDLNHPHILAQDGLTPSEGDPRFHQQMVFAVAMKTIRTFERALGRKILWSPFWEAGSDVELSARGEGRYQPIKRLRIYPHGIREANAYYSPDKKALLFGYFPASSLNAGASWVFTALSHDIIVHETTHAILDGIHRRYREASSVDSLAFHEAFADIVALLSHFTLQEAVRSEIASKGGELTERSLMSGLARQFGQATGRYSALRDGIDEKGGDNLPDPDRITDLSEPHERGAVVVAAVFDAFLTIYQSRTADLMRIGGVELDRRVHRELHPDLVNRLTKEATKTAEHLLNMCIRALDYLPPVDVRLGEYLRAIVTADADLVPDDRMHYRTAIIEAFRKRGIIPEHCLSLATDSLLWERPDYELDLTDLVHATEGSAYRLKLEAKFKRSEVEEVVEENRARIWRWLMQSDSTAEDELWEKALGVYFAPGRGSQAWRLNTISHWPEAKGGRPKETWPRVEVHSVRTLTRAGPDGQDLRQLVIEVAQRRRGFFDKALQKRQDTLDEKPQHADFVFRGGATLIIDLKTGKLRYVIRKSIDDANRLEVQRSFLLSRSLDGLGAAYVGPESAIAPKEPFGLVHRGG